MVDADAPLSLEPAAPDDFAVADEEDAVPSDGLGQADARSARSATAKCVRAIAADDRRREGYRSTDREGWRANHPHERATLVQTM
jgi:hypothetical protein